MKVGLTLGLIITASLAFFPGKQKSNENDKENSNRNDTMGFTSTTVDKKITENDSQIADASWAGDQIPSCKIEATRKLFGLTESQMRNVMDVSRSQALTDQCIEEHSCLSLTQKINVMVYIVLFASLIYAVNRDYDNAATLWFIHHFPNEARILRLA